MKARKKSELRVIRQCEVSSNAKCKSEYSNNEYSIGYLTC